MLQELLKKVLFGGASCWFSSPNAFKLCAGPNGDGTLFFRTAQDVFLDLIFPPCRSPGPDPSFFRFLNSWGGRESGIQNGGRLSCCALCGRRCSAPFFAALECPMVLFSLNFLAKGREAPPPLQSKGSPWRWLQPLSQSLTASE